MTHDDKLAELRSVIEATDGEYMSKRHVLQLISRLEGHLTAAEALERVLDFCRVRANDEAIQVLAREAYGAAYKHAVQLHHRVRP